MTVVPEIIAANAQPFLPMAAPSLTASASLDLSVPQQALDLWCWAAVTVGLEEFFGQPARTQCQIVSDVLEIACCPDGTDVQRCVVTRPPQMALGELFERRVPAPVGTSFQFIRDELASGLPVLAHLRFSEARFGHLVVISGFRRIGSSVTLTVWDPYTGQPSEQSLSVFRTSFQEYGSWRASYKLRRPGSLPPQ